MYDFSYLCKMQYPPNLVLENREYLIVLPNFLGCNYEWWFETTSAFNSYPCHASEMTKSTFNHCLKFVLCFIFCHICNRKKWSKNFSAQSLKLNCWSPRCRTVVLKLGYLSNALSFSQPVEIFNKFTQFERK